MKKIISIFLAGSCFLGLLIAQTRISYNGSGNYILRERTNLRRYENGKYVGLVTREISSFIIPTYSDNGYLYEGNFYVTQGTYRNNFVVGGQSLNNSIPAKFKISDTGAFFMLEDHGFPTYRGFPTYSNQKIKIGDSWSAKAERIVDPLNKGIVTKMPIYVQYVYAGDEVFNDEPVYLITAQWATRYGSGYATVNIDFGGDKDLVQATGTHKANIYVSKKSGNALVIHDTVDETFVYSDGNKYTFRGQISQFTEYPPAIDRNKILTVLQRVALLDDDDVEDYKLKADKKEIALADAGTGTDALDGLGTDPETRQWEPVFDDELSNNMKKKAGEGTDLALLDDSEKKNNKNDNFSMNDVSTKSNQWQQKNEIEWEKVSDDDLYSDTTNLNDKSKKKENIRKKLTKLQEGEGDRPLAKATTGTTPDNDTAFAGSFGEQNRNNGDRPRANDIGDRPLAKSNNNTTPDKSGDRPQTKKQPLITVDETEAGLRLTIPNLQFMPNSAELVTGEKNRLDKIAMALKEIGETKLLIEGHTARIGRIDDEQQLSEDRARSICNELIKRGINEGNIICKGSGGSKPIDDNSTPEGREKNRRVEITILD